MGTLRAVACWWCWLAALPAAADGPPAKADPVKAEVGRLQGTWDLVRAESQGTDVTAMFKGVIESFRFAGDTISCLGGDKAPAESRWTYRVDPTQRPKALDMLDAKGKPNASGFACELDGDTLKLAGYFVLFGDPPKGRPPTFDTKTDDRLLVLVFRKRAEK